MTDQAAERVGCLEALEVVDEPEAQQHGHREQRATIWLWVRAEQNWPTARQGTCPAARTRLAGEDRRRLGVAK